MVRIDSTFESEATLQEVFVLLTTCHPGFELGLGLQVTNKPVKMVMLFRKKILQTEPF